MTEEMADKQEVSENWVVVWMQAEAERHHAHRAHVKKIDIERVVAGMLDHVAVNLGKHSQGWTPEVAKLGQAFEDAVERVKNCRGITTVFEKALKPPAPDSDLVKAVRELATKGPDFLRSVTLNPSLSKEPHPNYTEWNAMDRLFAKVKSLLPPEESGSEPAETDCDHVWTSEGSPYLSHCAKCGELERNYHEPDCTCCNCSPDSTPEAGSEPETVPHQCEKCQSTETRFFEGTGCLCLEHEYLSQSGLRECQHHWHTSNLVMASCPPVYTDICCKCGERRERRGEMPVTIDNCPERE